MRSLREALESALVENPDDLATHCAYADYLQEHGDPRGEFIQLQLALEDPQRTEAQRRRLQVRADELQQTHQREWLGVLADELLGNTNGREEDASATERPYEIRFHRGWLDRIIRRADHGCSSHLGFLMCHAPATRLLRSLILEFDDGVVDQLNQSPYLGNLRVLQLGSRFAAEDLGQLFLPKTALYKLVVNLPRLERLSVLGRAWLTYQLFGLPSLTKLHVLQVSQLDDPIYLAYLASNPALGNLSHLWLRSGWARQSFLDLAGIRAILQSPYLRSLTHLHLHCSDLGDVGCTEIVTSGILKRLKVLDLRYGQITDTGARILADSPDLKRLELLDLGRNALTQAGLDALHRALGPAFRGDNQQTEEELGQRRYLSGED